MSFSVTRFFFATILSPFVVFGDFLVTLLSRFGYFRPIWGTDFYPALVLGRIALSLSLCMRVPNPSPVLDKTRAPMGPEFLSSTGAGVCRKAPKGFPDSSSVLDKFRSVTIPCCLPLL